MSDIHDLLQEVHDAAPYLGADLNTRVRKAMDIAAANAIALRICHWAEEGDERWETDCGHAFVINDGTPAENGMKYCCYCGRKLVQLLVDHDPDE